MSLENMIYNQLYNTPLELGLRALIILSAADDRVHDIQRLIFYDYILLHSGDMPSSGNNPESIHPDTPYRAGEILIKREIMSEGLLLMCKKQLLTVEFTERGIVYRANELTFKFLEYFKSTYFSNLRIRAKWVNDLFARYSEDDLKQFIYDNLDKWGGQFSKEQMIRGEEIV